MKNKLTAYIRKLSKKNVQKFSDTDKLEKFEKSNVVVSKIEILPETFVVDGTIHHKYLIEYTCFNMIGYGKLVSNAIRLKYSIDEELAIQRKALAGNMSEFEEYNIYVEQCKTLIREFVDKRKTALSSKPNIQNLYEEANQ